ncbi:hypothetical protein ACFY7Z_19235 [Streptomyces sp. NPDC012623]|uniref:hypothetical protein n=1 Tax=unclassified Streptomyces TaxID=2593676 RepID=UPI0036B6C607
MSRAQPPPPGFLAGCTLSSWLDLTQAGPTAWPLIGHSRPRRARETAASIEAGPQALADSMGLRPATSRIPRVSARLRIRALTVALDYGHDDYLLRVRFVECAN